MAEKLRETRRYSLLDRLVQQSDTALRTLAGTHVRELRPLPSTDVPVPALADDQRRHVAGLMRVNHSGEVCAQALYQGQALTARLPRVARQMEQAALEEEDHLAWCEQRLRELDSHPSILNPLWYAMSLGIGAAAGVAGDRWSLGFVEETEVQVCAHLEGHLEHLPPADQRSRGILEQMREDEARHADMARRAGATRLPEPVRSLMGLVAKVMTRSSYHV
jgi:ubiquinone biosynthesis monooxygenase Coq7